MFAEGLLVRYSPRETRATRTLAASASLGETWLHPREHDELKRYRHPDRRETWLAGRLLGKQLILHALREVGANGAVSAEIDIRSRGDDGKQVRPEVFIAGQRLPWCLSISHSAGGVLAALSLDPRVRVGVDLAPVEDRRAGFLRLWFTEREQQRLATFGPVEVARYWAAKEAVYKAVNEGERFAPRRIEIVAVTDTIVRGRVEVRGLAIECRVETRAYGNEIGAIAVWRTGSAYPEGGSDHRRVEPFQGSFHVPALLPQGGAASPLTLGCVCRTPFGVEAVVSNPLRGRSCVVERPSR